jgi:hypothetical protein
MQNEYFVGRDEELSQIRKDFANKRTAPAQTLSGPGGVGKTQAVLEFAYRFHGDYDVIWWMNAESHRSLLTDAAKFLLSSDRI